MNGSIPGQLRRLVAVALLCALVVPTSAWRQASRVDAQDRDGDGRPDLWRVHDGDGHVVAIAQDSNDDGRPDIVETFDVDGGPVRQLTDVDYDGTADVLDLYKDGVAVSQEWRRPASTDAGVPAPAGGLVDPFRSAPAFEAGTASAADADCGTLVRPVTVSPRPAWTGLRARATRLTLLAPLLPRRTFTGPEPTRGPPRTPPL